MTGYVRPASLDEALAARAQHGDWVVLAGGTDLLVGAGARPDPVGIIDLFGCRSLVGISQEQDLIQLGAATTYAELLRSELLWRRLPMLCEAAREVGALQIQARGTLGGNVATSSPVGDMLPVLLALGASIEVASVQGHRIVPYDEFCVAYRKTTLRSDELIVRVAVPVPVEGTCQFWRKVGTRRAQSISKVMFAATGLVKEGVIASVRMAFGAMAARPLRASAAEQTALGRPPSPETVALVREAIAREFHPIDDVRSSADYRLHVAQNLAARFLGTLVE